METLSHGPLLLKMVGRSSNVVDLQMLPTDREETTTTILLLLVRITGVEKTTGGL